MSDSRRWTHALDWNLLRTFVVLAEERSVTRAADRLLLQQPTVSAALKRLEEAFACRLFERGRRPMILTPQGEKLFGECRSLYGAIAALEPRAAHPVSTVAGTVRLNMVTQVINAGLDDVFRRLHAVHPGISFNIDVSTSYDIVRAVSQQIVPFGICLLAKPVSTLTCQFLFREDFAIFCGPDHALFNVGEVDYAAIRSEAWVSFACAELANSLEPMLSLRLGADLASRVVMSSSDLQEVRRFIAAGIGIGILPVEAVARDVRDGHLRRITLTDQADLGADVYFIRNPIAEPDTAEQAFIEAMGRFEPAP